MEKTKEQQHLFAPPQERKYDEKPGKKNSIYYGSKIPGTPQKNNNLCKFGEMKKTHLAHRQINTNYNLVPQFPYQKKLHLFGFGLF